MIRFRMRWTSRALLAVAFAFIALVLGTAAASAAPIVVPRDADGHVVVEMTANKGGISGTLSVINPTAKKLQPTITGLGGIALCKKFDPITIPARSTTDITLKSDKCTLDKNGDEALMSFDGSKVPIKIDLKQKDAGEAVSLGASLPAFLFAAIGAGLLLGLVWLSRPKDEDDKKLGWSDEIVGAPSGWTFKESWATNVGTISTVFVAIFGTNDVVKALVTDESKTLPGRLLLIAGISGLVLGVAPLVLKAIGPKSETATAFGLLVAGWLTTTAIAGQVVAVYAAFGVDDPKGSVWSDFFHGFDGDGPLAVVVVLIVVLVGYVFRTLHALLDPTVAPPKPSDELLIASATLVAAEVCCEDGKTPDYNIKLLEIAYVRAVNHLERLARPKKAGKPKAGEHTKGVTVEKPESVPQYADLPAILKASAGRRDARSALL